MTWQAWRTFWVVITVTALLCASIGVGTMAAAAVGGR